MWSLFLLVAVCALILLHRPRGKKMIDLRFLRLVLYDLEVL